jgi:hypothetical protein
MTPQHRIGKTSEREMNEMAEESYRQITGQNPVIPQPQIVKAINVVKPYHVKALVDGWLCIKYLDGGEESLSTFADVSKGDMIIFGNASRPAPSPKSGCDGCRKEVEHLDCPRPGNCDQMKCPICCESTDFPTLPEEIKKYEEAAAAKAREDVLDKLREWSIVQYEISGVIDTMTLKQKIESLRTEGDA